MTHKYAPILNAIMDGKTIQHLQPDQSYTNLSEDKALWHLGQYGSGYNLRVKPDTLNIAGVEVVKPMTDKPRVGCVYYFISPSNVEGVSSANYMNFEEHSRMVESGMCWLTRDAAVNAASAIKKLLKGE